MDSAADVAGCGYEAMKRGDEAVVFGQSNRDFLARAAPKSELENAGELAEILKPRSPAVLAR